MTKSHIKTLRLSFLILLTILQYLTLAQKCDSKVQHCVTCKDTNPKACIQCEDNYHLNKKSSPTTCSKCPTGCLKCSEKKCIQCDEGWFEVKDAKELQDSCSKCNSNCKTCSYSSVTCTSCVRFYKVDVDSDECIFRYTILSTFGLIIASIFLILICIGMYKCLIEKPGPEEVRRRNRKAAKRKRREQRKKEGKDNLIIQDVGYNGEDLLTIPKQSAEQKFGSIDFDLGKGSIGVSPNQMVKSFVGIEDLGDDENGNYKQIK